MEIAALSPVSRLHVTPCCRHCWCGYGVAVLDDPSIHHIYDVEIVFLVERHRSRLRRHDPPCRSRNGKRCNAIQSTSGNAEQVCVGDIGEQEIAESILNHIPGQQGLADALPTELSDQSTA